jgi:hypothetical protein
LRCSHEASIWKAVTRQPAGFTSEKSNTGFSFPKATQRMGRPEVLLLLNKMTCALFRRTLAIWLVAMR